ncbi:hypothetical protein GCM10023189_46250 [Nibrella saemangeumensis]|uniref:Cupin type-2 domain-containing protein n=1 Tax=Nibrella saemangeumensis TaxID=1084526 RepID=A0ABP8NHM7_9BACT
MAYIDQVIANPKTGQSIRFIQTSRDTRGRLLEMESTYNPHSTEPVAHYHPQQDEAFTVLAGALTVRINGTLTALKAGDTLHIPKNTIHSMWNNGDQPAVVNWQVRPALNTEFLLESGMRLASDGKTKADGTPPLLQAVVLVHQFRNEYRLAKPPYAVQRLLFPILAAIGRLLGYRATYEKYNQEQPGVMKVLE